MKEQKIVCYWPQQKSNIWEMNIAVRIRPHTQKTKLHTFTVEYSSLLIRCSRASS